jgi:hypothetical protein
MVTRDQVQEQFQAEFDAEPACVSLRYEQPRKMTVTLA